MLVGSVLQSDVKTGNPTRTFVSTILSLYNEQAPHVAFASLLYSLFLPVVLSLSFLADDLPREKEKEEREYKLKLETAELEKQKADTLLEAEREKSDREIKLKHIEHTHEMELLEMKAKTMSHYNQLYTIVYALKLWITISHSKFRNTINTRSVISLCLLHMY